MDPKRPARLGLMLLVVVAAALLSTVIKNFKV